MEVVSIEGHAPGSIVATLSHGTRVRQLPMNLAIHPAGGWQIRQSDGGFGPRCHAVSTAVLLEASEMFAEVALDYAE